MDPKRSEINAILNTVEVKDEVGVELGNYEKYYRSARSLIYFKVFFGL